MFRDRDQELQRLQQQLLEEEEIPTPEEKDEDLLDEETVDALLESADQTGDAGAYQNFSNGYGRQPVETEGRFYNADHVDVDLDEFSEDVCAPEKTRSYTGLLVFLLLCMLAALGFMIWLYRQMGGFL